MNTKREDVLSWDDYFMATAFLAAMRSKDPCTQVGACIVNEDKRIVGVGYNGMPNRCSDDEFSWSRKNAKRFKLDKKSLYGKKSAQSGSCSSDVNYQFFIMKKINADMKLRHFVTAHTEG
jgi:deoxycytidylate deaminase